MGSFIPVPPGTGHSWPPTLTQPSDSHVLKLLSKPALGTLRWPDASVSPPPNTLGRGHPRPSRVGTQRDRKLAPPLAARALSPAHQQLHLAARPPSPPPPPEPRNQASAAHTLRSPATLAQGGRKAHAQLARPALSPGIGWKLRLRRTAAVTEVSLQTTETENG